MDADRDVDREQVDRCQTCHMGTAVGIYTDASIPRQFRTHPLRSTLLNAHPVETVRLHVVPPGPGPRHRQARALRLAPRRGGRQGALALRGRSLLGGSAPARRASCTGSSSTTGTTSSRSEINKGELDEDHPRAAEPGRPRQATPPSPPTTTSSPQERGGAKLNDEALFFGAIQAKVQEVVKADDGVAAKWHAVVRKLDNRVQIGLEQNNPTEVLSAKESARLQRQVHQARARRDARLRAACPRPTGASRSSSPRRRPSRRSAARARPTSSKAGATCRRAAREGLQVPDDMRNRFIQALPEMESSCLRCHTGDVDLKPRASQAKYVIVQAGAREGRGVEGQGPRRLQGGARRVGRAAPRGRRPRRGDQPGAHVHRGPRTSSRSSTAPAATSSTASPGTATRAPASTT